METMLLTGISGVTGALVFVCKLLWKQAEECKSDRAALRREIEALKFAAGKLELMQDCHQHECPFRKPFEHRPISKDK